MTPRPNNSALPQVPTSPQNEVMIQLAVLEERQKGHEKRMEERLDVIESRFDKLETLISGTQDRHITRMEFEHFKKEDFGNVKGLAYGGVTLALLAVAKAILSMAGL